MNSLLQPTLFNRKQVLPTSIRLRFLDQVPQQRFKGFSWKLFSSHAVQVRIANLAVQQPVTTALQLPAKRHQCDLAGISPAAEHGLTKKYGTHSKAVDAAYQQVTLPDLQ